MDNSLAYWVEQTVDLKKQMFYMIRDEIDYIINDNIRDNYYIETTLDKMIECIYDDYSETYFLKLCFYYAKINIDASIFYLKFYKDNYR